MTTVLGSKRTFLDYTDTEAMDFLNIVCDITAIPDFQKLKNYRHHYSTNRYQHCLNVAWYTYIWCRKAGLDYESAARGAMLHDFFFYDWRHKEEVPFKGNHCTVHPMVALANAEKYFELNAIERDCILNHMWPSSFVKPSTKEGLIITLADKYCASLEIGKFTGNKVPALLSAALRKITGVDINEN